MTETGIDEGFADELVTTCRTGIGDTLRNVIYFTASGFDLLYVRDDLYDGDEERAREVAETFVNNERYGFGTQETYHRLTGGEEEPDIGDYVFTVRVFSDGFVSRVIVGDHGVLVTSDQLHLADAEEGMVSLRKALEEREGP